jgi:pyruvate formate lyase activating enzyme
MTEGLIHSFQSLGTVDGPGVRFVVFFQGCALRCLYCHNPDTWDMEGGTVRSSHELAQNALHYREYFGSRGGVTLSGGEPLLQAEFSAAFFRECKKNGLHTCLDTSGVIFNDAVAELLSYTDRVLLDVKYPTDELYQRHVGCTLGNVLQFLDELNERKIPTTIRQVLIPSLNDTHENAEFLARLKRDHSVVDQIEILPFKKLCTVKYERLSIPFPFADFAEPTDSDVSRIEKMIADALSEKA